MPDNFCCVDMSFLEEEVLIHFFPTSLEASQIFTDLITFDLRLEHLWYVFHANQILQINRKGSLSMDAFSSRALKAY